MIASAPGASRVELFLCGDVMTGRGIDQVLAHPGDPRLHESYATSALDYVELAEIASGPIPRAVAPSYLWGDALAELEARSPDLRLVNLETSVTTSDQAQPKGINYRMHPANVACLSAAGLDCCVLANNHVLDWGSRGLLETLDTLRGAGLATAGAGRNLEEAERPALFELAWGRLLVFGLGSPTSGIPREWAAAADRPGVSLLADLSTRGAERVAERIGRFRSGGDRVVVSIHCGGNWGHEVAQGQREFARRLIELGAADVIHGHSSHHPKAIEVHEGRPILYGCGDFLNDYEGIPGHEEFRGELVLGYFLALDAASGALVRLELAPFRIRRFRLERVPRADAEWLRATLERVSRPFGTRVELTSEGRLEVNWR